MRISGKSPFVHDSEPVQKRIYLKKKYFEETNKD